MGSNDSLSSSSSSSSSPRRNRGDILTSVTHDPYPAVQALGQSSLHGPSIDQHIVFILGVGPGLGLAIAQLFAKQGYTVAIASRNKERLDGWAKELDQIIKNTRKAFNIDIQDNSPQSLAFACDVLSPEAIRTTFEQIAQTWPKKRIGTAIFNASIRKRGPFLEQRSDQLQDSIQASITGGFTFMQTAIRSMMKNNNGKGGNILVTGATSSIRGREGFAAFAASKGGLRQICQSVAREYGPNHIHVAHIIVDGLIDSQEARNFLGLQKGQRFATDSVLRPEEMAKAWLFLASQNESVWTFEMDMRPAREHF